MLTRRSLLFCVVSGGGLVACNSLGGDSGREVNDNDDDERRDRDRDEDGDRVNQRFTPRASAVSRWHSDPWARGSYSYQRVGSSPDDRNAFNRLVDGRITFAGEHTHVGYPSTAHGALMSGRDAAARLIDGGLDESDIRPVVVIGAGFAGLGAARALADEGIPVIVVEARDRLGGRCFTTTLGDVPMDLGCSWIHGIELNPLAELAQEAGIEWALANDEESLEFDGDFDEIDDEDAKATSDDAWEAIEEVVEQAEEFDDDVSLGALLAELDLDDETLFAIRRGVEHEYAADLDELSAWWWDAGEEVTDDAIHGDEVVFPGGYSRVIDALAVGLDIRLNTPVASLSWTRAGASITTADGELIDGAAVIVTLPLGVLQAGTVRFDGELPNDITAAIGRLGMGTLNKVVLLFDDVFWPEDVGFIGFNRDDGRFIECLNLYQQTGEPVLMCFTAGTPAVDQEALTDDELVADAIDMLREAFA
jgi:polyamine oxidase